MTIYNPERKLGKDEMSGVRVVISEATLNTFIVNGQRITEV